MSSNHSQYRTDIDGLRAIAVIIVILYHASFSWFSGGYVGVDVFFVISGFLITGLLYKEVEKTGTISFKSFYAKRFKRLYPALIFVILVSIVIWGIFFLSIPARTEQFLKSIKYSIFGLANFFFQKNTGGYFDTSSEEMPLLHFWSLAVEEQFYLVWPLLIWISAKSKARLISVLIMISVISFVLTEYLLIKGLAQSAFYMMPARAWELGLGGLLYFIINQARSLPKRILNIAGVTGLLSILLSTFFYKIDSRFPGALALIPALGTFLIILSGTQKGMVYRILSQPVLVKLGVLSYGWYLWHWPLLAFERMYFLGEVPPLEWRWGAIILSLVMAQVSLKFIESPIRFGKKINALSSTKVIVGSLLISLMIVGVSRGLVFLGNKKITPEYAEIIKMTKAKVSAQFGCIGKVSLDIDKACVVNPEIDSGTDLLLWGDSHARAYFPLFEKKSKENSTRMTLVAGSYMVPILDIEKIYFSTKSTTLDIGDQNQSIYKNLKEKIKSGKSINVVLISRWTNFLGHKNISIRDGLTYVDPKKDSSVSSQIFASKLIETITKLEEAGVKKILIFLPTPEFKYEVADCHHETECNTSVVEFEKYRSSVVTQIRDIQSRFKNIEVIDPVETFCSNGICPQIMATDEGKSIPVVFDDDHVTTEAALFLGRKEKEKIEWIFQ